MSLSTLHDELVKALQNLEEKQVGRSQDTAAQVSSGDERGARVSLSATGSGPASPRDSELDVAMSRQATKESIIDKTPGYSQGVTSASTPHPSEVSLFSMLFGGAPDGAAGQSTPTTPGTARSLFCLSDAGSCGSDCPTNGIGSKVGAPKGRGNYLLGAAQIQPARAVFLQGIDESTSTCVTGVAGPDPSCLATPQSTSTSSAANPSNAEFP